MAKTTKKKSKKRATNYEPKLKFDGTFKELVEISIKDAEKQKKTEKK